MKNNVHKFNCEFKPTKVLLLSDVHWDSPYCDRELLKRHLEEAKAIGAHILLNGDTFDLMGSRRDFRGSKGGLRPEFKVDHYFDEIANQAIEWFSPYADLIKVVGYGNHETAIIKHNEVDLIQRFVGGLNMVNDTHIQTGGYGGWIVYTFERKGSCSSYRIKYMHGIGGGVVTKGVIGHQRMSTFVQGADMIWQGHVHEDYEMNYRVEAMNSKSEVHYKDVLMVRTSTYKDEYKKDDSYGASGWAIEKGFSPRFLGGRWLELTPVRKVVEGREWQYVKARTYQTQ
jgi:hypothetical protein